MPKAMVLEQDPILSTGPEVEIEGITYKLRRLGIRDLFRLADLLKEILGKGSMELQVRFQGVDLFTQFDSFLTFFFLGFGYAEKEMLSFLASLIGVSEEEITNQEKFPMPCVLDIVEALITRHRDFHDFFSRMGKKLARGTPPAP